MKLRLSGIRWRYFSRKITSDYYSKAPLIQMERAKISAEKALGYISTQFDVFNILRPDLEQQPKIRSIIRRIDPVKKAAHKNLPMMSLLLAKTAGIPTNSKSMATMTLNWAIEPGVGLLAKQRQLAECLALITSMHVLRCQGPLIMRNPQLVDGETDKILGDTMAFLNERISDRLTKISNPTVSQLMRDSMSDLVDAEYMDLKLRQLIDNGCPINCLDKWFTMANKLASISAAGCSSVLMLADHEHDACSLAYDFGRDLALSWTIHEQVHSFLTEDSQQQQQTSNETDGTSDQKQPGPITFHRFTSDFLPRDENSLIVNEYDKTLYSLISLLHLQKQPNDVFNATNLNRKTLSRKLLLEQVRENMDKTETVSKAKALLEFYAQECHNSLSSLDSYLNQSQRQEQGISSSTSTSSSTSSSSAASHSGSRTLTSSLGSSIELRTACSPSASPTSTASTVTSTTIANGSTTGLSNSPSMAALYEILNAFTAS